MAKNNLDVLGKWAFIIGLVVAVIGGLVSTQFSGGWAILLVILGLVVGFLNITSKEVTGFLVAAIALIVAGSAGLEVVPSIGANLQAILGNIAVFLAPAAIIVGVKAVYSTAKSK